MKHIKSIFENFEEMYVKNAQIFEDIFDDLKDKYDSLTVEIKDSHGGTLLFPPKRSLGVLSVYICWDGRKIGGEREFGEVEEMGLLRSSSLKWTFGERSVGGITMETRKVFIKELQKSPFFQRIFDLTGYSIISLQRDLDQAWFVFAITNKDE